MRARRRWQALVGTGAVATSCGLLLLLAAAACGKDYGAEAETPGEDGGRDVVAETGEGGPAPACDPANAASDPNHCGRCGHSCLGGTCSGGKCQPFLVGNSQGEIVIDVAVDAKRVLWTTSNEAWSATGHLLSCPKSGCGSSPPSSLAGEGKQVGSLTGDGKTAYVSFVFATRRIARVDADGLLETLISDHAAPVRLQVRDGSLYFLSLYEQSAFDGGTAASIRRFVGPTETVVALYDDVGFRNFRDLVAISPSIVTLMQPYVIDALVSGTRSELTASAGNVISATTDGLRVIWAAADFGTVVACSLPGPCATPTTLLGPAQLDGSPRAVVFAAGQLYVSTAKGSLLACDPARCAATLVSIARGAKLHVANEFYFGHTVTADDDAVYWSEVDAVASPDGGIDPSTAAYRIMKLAK